jgi:hypothetical protein
MNMVGWIHGVRSLSPQLDWAWHEVAVVERLFQGVAGLDLYKARLALITNNANELLFGMVEAMSYAHESGRAVNIDRKEVEFECKQLLNQLTTTRDEFVYHNQAQILEVLGIEMEEQYAVAPH